jgi:uncharacterized membrane protein
VVAVRGLNEVWGDSIQAVHVHPLFIVGGFIAHTALSVLFAMLVAPMLIAGVGISVVGAATIWLALGIVVLLIAVIKQRASTNGIVE